MHNNAVKKYLYLLLRDIDTFYPYKPLGNNYINNF